MSVPNTRWGGCIAPGSLWQHSRLVRAFCRSLLDRPKWSMLVCFILPFLFRLLPQLVAGASTPIGYDTVAGYAPFARLVQEHGLSTELTLLLQAHFAPLLWLLIGGLATTGIHPFILVEVLPPFLYGLLGVAIWRFSKQVLKWDRHVSIIAVILTLSYFLPLRYAWDALKDVMGVTLLFSAMTEVPRLDIRRGRIVFATFSVASVLTEEVMAVLLGGIALVYFLRGLRTRRASILWLVTGLGCLVSVLFYAGLIGPAGPGPFPPYGVPGPSIPGPVLLQGITTYPTWDAKASAATILIAMALAPLAYPAWRGRSRSLTVNAWIAVSATATFGIFLMPDGEFFPVWPTWLVLLSFPLGLISARGMTLMSRCRAAALAVVFLILAGSYVALPASSALPYFTSAQTRWYVPTSMVQTTIPLDRVPGVELAVAWLNTHATDKDWIVVSNVFAGFVVVFGNASRLYPYQYVNRVNWSLFSGATTLYTIYWADPSDSWFAGGPPPPVFREVFVADGVSVLATNVNQLVS